MSTHVYKSESNWSRDLGDASLRNLCNDYIQLVLEKRMPLYNYVDGIIKQLWLLESEDEKKNIYKSPVLIGLKSQKTPLI